MICSITQKIKPICFSLIKVLFIIISYILLRSPQLKMIIYICDALFVTIIWESTPFNIMGHLQMLREMAPKGPTIYIYIFERTVPSSSLLRVNPQKGLQHPESQYKEQQHQIQPLSPKAKSEPEGRS